MTGPGLGEALAVAATVVLLFDVTVVMVTRAAATESIGRNHVAGIRLPSLMRSDASWRAGHQAAYPPTVIGAVVSAVVAVVSVALSATVTPYVVALAASIGSALVGITIGVVRAHRAATAVTGETAAR